MPSAPRNHLSEILWGAWGALGVSSWSKSAVHTVVDPEALIVATAALGDERLFQESIDWGIEHAALLLPARMRHMAPEAGRSQQVESWIATVGANTAAVTWRSPEVELEDFERSRKSASFAERQPAAAAALRSRSILGAHTRAEVVRSLHVVAAGLETALTSAEITWLAAGTKSPVNNVLEELVRGGFVTRTGTPKRRRFGVVDGSVDMLAGGWWRPWQSLPYAPWRLAPVIVSHLSHVLAITEAGRPRSTAVEAVVHFQAVLPYLARLDPALATPMDTGAASRVLAHVRSRALAASERLADVLAHGVQAAAPRPATGVREIDGVNALSIPGNPWDRSSAWFGRGE